MADYVVIMDRYVSSNLANEKIQYGATIPGTGFTLLRSNEIVGQGPVLILSYPTWILWKRLWHLRCHTRFKSQLSDTQEALPPRAGRRAKNLDRQFKDSALGEDGKTVSLILTSTFLVYGGVHLLAWQYNFQTDAEGIMWKIAAITTASSGLIILSAQTAYHLRELPPNSPNLQRLKASLFICLAIFGCFLTFFEIPARSFLVIESFRALPNSPSSVYEIPRWTAYLPHI
jgi:hypothetical protein